MAQRTHSLLAQKITYDAAAGVPNVGTGWVELWTTGAVATLQDAAERWITGSGPAHYVELF